MSNRFARNAIGAWRQTLYEQNVEDINTVYKFNNYLDRKLIVLPIETKSSSLKHGLMLGKEQFSDKCSLPRSVGALLYEKMFESPWTFEISKISDGKSLSSVSSNFDATNTVADVNKVYASALDFRAPENYVFVPPWMMTALGLQNWDIVSLRFLKLHPVSMVTLQPLTLDWDKLTEEEGDAIQGVLEGEINKYSTLTAGTTITINVKGRKLQLFVKETLSEGLGGAPVAVSGVRIQDADVRTNIDRSLIPQA
jgi:hypothetical protein